MDPRRAPVDAGRSNPGTDPVHADLQTVDAVAVIGCRGDGEIATWNVGAERLLRYPAGDVIGHRLQDLMRTPGQRSWLTRILDADSPVRLHRADVPRSDGTTVGCIVSSERCAGPAGERMRSLLLLPLPAAASPRDDANGESTDPPLNPRPHTLDSLGVLAGGIAHDFNNLLLGMVGHADLALMELPPGHAVRDHVDQIAQAGLRAADLCRQLMAFSGTGVTLKEQIDLSALVRDLMPLMRMSLGAAPLELEIAERPPQVEADTTQIRQVILNLVTNAAEAVTDRPDGRVTVRTRLHDPDAAPLRDPVSGHALPPGDYVLVEVQDNGAGMTEDQVTRAFEPFFTTKFMGRGLGLASAYGIVRAHGGSIVLCSAPATGTTVTVALPSVRAATAPAPAPAQRPQPAPVAAERERPRILVVDDESHVRVVASTILGHADFEVTLAEHGGEALEILAGDPASLDLVLLDLTMPGLDGFEVLARVRQLRADLPVLLSSGYGPERAAHVVADDPHTAFLAKPYRRHELLAAVEALLPAAGPDANDPAPPPGGSGS